ncbi:hypothetical protein GCM10025777_15340 [Membranihabitans marinus]
MLSFLAPFSYHFGKVAFMSNLAIMLSLGFAANISGYEEILRATILLFCGGLWYMIFASVMHFIQRPIQSSRRISRTIQLTAEYLALRQQLLSATNVSKATTLELSKKQAQISESHEKVRGMLMRDYGYRVSPKSRMGKLLHIFAALVDLFDEAIASTGKLMELVQIEDHDEVKKMLIDINDLFITSLNHLQEKINHPQLVLEEETVRNTLRQKIVRLEEYMIQWRDGVQSEQNTEYDYRTFKSIQIYMDQQMKTLDLLFSYLKDQVHTTMQGVNPESIRHFQTHDRLDIHRLASHLTLKSGYFRYALRVAFTAMTAYFIAMLLNFQNPNWALFTSLVILKPGFKVSQKRLLYRVLGTGIGVILSFVIFVVIAPSHEWNILLFLIAFFGGFAFLNKNYAIASIFFTMYILFLYRFLDRAFIPSALFRFLDTGLAAILCIFSIRLLFPFWENKSIKYFLVDSLQASKTYFVSIYKGLLTKNQDITPYKIDRKEAQLKMSNLMTTYQRILTEPKSKQGNVNDYASWIMISSSLLSVCSNLGLFLQRHPNYVLERMYIIDYFEKIISYWDKILDMATTSNKEIEDVNNEIASMKMEMSSDINRLQDQIAKLSGGYTEITIHYIQEMIFVEELYKALELLENLDHTIRHFPVQDDHSIAIKYS